MPTYEYLCDKCGKFEEFQSIKADALDKCPKCGSPIKRLISAGGGMIFKGSGFYATENRKPEYKEKEKAENKRVADGNKGTTEKASNNGSKEPGKPAVAQDSPGKEKADGGPKT